MQGAGGIADLLASAVKQNVKAFDKQMDKWYADQKKNGREINLTIRCWDNWENDLETEYGGEELTDCIQSWLRNNCVNGAFKSRLLSSSRCVSRWRMKRERLWTLVPLLLCYVSIWLNHLII